MLFGVIIGVSGTQKQAETWTLNIALLPLVLLHKCCAPLLLVRPEYLTTLHDACLHFHTCFTSM